MSVYDDALNMMDGRGKGEGGSGGQDFLKLPKPAQVGHRLQKRLRIIQRFACGPDGKAVQPMQALPEFWLLQDQHTIPGRMVGSDRKVETANCPDSAIHSDRTWRTKMTCPICIKQNDLWLTKDPALEKAWEALRFRQRLFVNAIDMENPPEHWEQQPDGSYLVAPKTWAFGIDMFKDLLGFCRNLGPIEDWRMGRDLIVEVEKTGSEDMNVKYRVTPCDPSPIDQSLMPIVMNAGDLRGLGAPSTMERLQELAAKADPRGGSRVAASHQGGYSPPAQQSYAAPQGYSPPPAAYAPPPPSMQHPMGPPTGTTYSYNSPTGPIPGQTASQIAQIVKTSAGPHNVWAAGWPQWQDATQVPEISALLNSAPPQPAPVAAPPPPQQMTQGGHQGYIPQGYGPPPGQAQQTYAPPPGGPPAQQQAAPPPGPPGPPQRPPAGPQAAPPGGPPMPPGRTSW